MQSSSKKEKLQHYSSVLGPPKKHILKHLNSGHNFRSILSQTYSNIIVPHTSANEVISYRKVFYAIPVVMEMKGSQSSVAEDLSLLGY